MSGQHHGNSCLTVQQLYLHEYVAARNARRAPFAWPACPTRHRRNKRQRVELDTGVPADQKPIYRIKNGLVVGLLSLLLAGCVPPDGDAPARPEVSTDSPNPTVIPSEVLNG